MHCKENFGVVFFRVVLRDVSPFIDSTSTHTSWHLLDNDKGVENKFKLLECVCTEQAYMYRSF